MVKSLCLICGTLLSFSTLIFASTRIQYFGAVPDVVTENKRVLEDLLEVLYQTTGITSSYSTEIYFLNFGESSKGFPHLDRAYMIESWSKSKYLSAKKTFWAYAFTPEPEVELSIIQVSDKVFKNYYTVDPTTGLKNLPTGTGFPQLAHELLHTVLFMDSSIREEDHHCLFIEAGYLEPALNFLISKNLLREGTKQFILHGEYQNCLRGRKQSK